MKFLAKSMRITKWIVVNDLTFFWNSLDIVTNLLIQKFCLRRVKWTRGIFEESNNIFLNKIDCIYYREESHKLWVTMLITTLWSWCLKLGHTAICRRKICIQVLCVHRTSRRTLSRVPDERNEQNQHRPLSMNAKLSKPKNHCQRFFIQPAFVDAQRMAS